MANNDDDEFTQLFPCRRSRAGLGMGISSNNANSINSINITPKTDDAKYGKGGLKRKLAPKLAALRAHPSFAEVAATVRFRRMAMIPATAVLAHPDFAQQLRMIATVDVKLIKFGNIVRSKPWPMFVDERGALLIPRMLAAHLFFGASAQTSNAFDLAQIEQVSQATEVFAGIACGERMRPTRRALYTPEDCVGHPDRAPQTLIFAAATRALDAQLSAGQPFAGTTICFPPGKGKTMTGVHLAAHYGVKTMFVVPNLSMIPQVMAEAASVLGPECRVGSMHTSEPRNLQYADKDFVVCSLMSLLECDYAHIMPEFGMVIFDECHEHVAAHVHHVYNRTAAKYIVAMTATPERKDEAGAYIEWLAGPICWFQSLEISATRWGCVNVVVHELRYTTKPLECRHVQRCGERMLDQEHVHQQLATHAARTSWLHELVMAEARDRHVLCLGSRVLLMKNLFYHLRERGADVGLQVGESNMADVVNLELCGDGDNTDNSQHNTQKGTKHTSKRSKLEARDAVRQRRILIFSDQIGYKGLNKPELSSLIVLGPPLVDINGWLQRVGRILRDCDKQTPTLHLIKDLGVPEFERLVDTVTRKLAAFSSSFKFSVQTHQI